FSSSRRHTRFSRDWSSDVCSSDLWGMNPAARWDSLVMYDKHDTNGTELRAFAGNFLISTGANEYADRFTNGHFDLPLRHCTIERSEERRVGSDRGRTKTAAARGQD